MKNVLIFGSSIMAEEYLRVIKALNHNAIIIGRDSQKAKVKLPTLKESYLAHKILFEYMKKHKIGNLNIT